MEKIKVLVVDDESRMRKLVSDFLTRDGYEVIEAGDGEEAVEIFFQNKDIAVILLDVMMPKMNGLEVLKTIRDKKNLIPILMLTAKAEIDDKVEGLDLGANDYLTKPFNSRELLARIRAMTRTQTAQANSQLKFGNITLDRATYELSTVSGNYRLANKEFQIMEMLMSNPKCLVSSERFMEKIWGYDSEAEINVVWVYISYLRKKLSALHADIQIKATRNAGYSLEERS